MSGDLPGGAPAANQPPWFSPAVDAWIVTRHEDALAVLGSHAIFSSRTAYADQLERAGCPHDVTLRLGETVPPGTIQLVASDRPDHARVRSVAARVFARAAVSGWEPLVGRFADEMAAGIAPIAPLDLVARFVAPFSARMVLLVIGLDPGELDRIAGWVSRASEMFFLPLDDAGKRRSGEALVDLQERLLALVRSRRAAPARDLASDLVAASAGDPDPLTDAELVQLLVDLCFAGSDPVATVFSSLLLRLMLAEDAWPRAVAADASLDLLVEEAVRLASGLRGIVRRTREDACIGGTNLPAGSTVLVVPGPVNRDTAAFDAPGAIRLDRPNPRAHIGFGYGIHYCVGAPLGRLAIRAGLIALARRFPALRLWKADPVGFVRAPMITQIRRLLVDPGV